MLSGQFHWRQKAAERRCRIADATIAIVFVANRCLVLLAKMQREWRNDGKRLRWRSRRGSGANFENKTIDTRGELLCQHFLVVP